MFDLNRLKRRGKHLSIQDLILICEIYKSLDRTKRLEEIAQDVLHIDEHNLYRKIRQIREKLGGRELFNRKRGSGSGTAKWRQTGKSAGKTILS